MLHYGSQIHCHSFAPVPNDEGFSSAKGHWMNRLKKLLTQIKKEVSLFKRNNSKNFNMKKEKDFLKGLSSAPGKGQGRI